MADEFPYDVFLSHSSKDKLVVREIARRLQTDGIHVWFDEEQIKPGDSIPAKIEEGLEHSRVLVLCMSANAFGSDWAQLESGTFRFRDPLNKERRFLPLRLDDAPIKGSLAQFLYINWLPTEREQEYVKLREACNSAAILPGADSGTVPWLIAENSVKLDYNAEIRAWAFDPDGRLGFTAADDKTARLWDLKTGRCLRVFKGHTNELWCLAWSRDQRLLLSGGNDQTVRLWDVESGRCLKVFEGHSGQVQSLAWSVDHKRAYSGSGDGTLRIWDIETGRCLRTLRAAGGHIALRAGRSEIVSGSAAGRDISLWAIEGTECLLLLKGHTNIIWCVDVDADGDRALSGSDDKTVRLWDLQTGRCLRVLEGHTAQVLALAWSADGNFALSGAGDGTARLWDLETGRCRRVLGAHESNPVKSVAWSRDGRRAFSGDSGGGIRVWDLSEFVTEARAPKVTVPALPRAPEQIQYTNAKVLLVGESGAGKTGLSKRLAMNDWQPSDSTVGAWATQ